MWRTCTWMVLLATVVIAEESSPGPPASIAAAPKPERIFEIEGPEEALRVSFDDLCLRKLLDVQKVPVDVEDRLPEWLKTLNGKTVRIRGWMFPPPTETELPAFWLVRDNTWMMHFGRRIRVDEKVGVRMRKGVTADYIAGRPFDVAGKLTIKSRVRDGELFLLYVIEDAVVIDKQGAIRLEVSDPGRSHSH